jgi:hypothetical protein
MGTQTSVDVGIHGGGSRGKSQNQSDTVFRMTNREKCQLVFKLGIWSDVGTGNNLYLVT